MLFTLPWSFEWGAAPCILDADGRVVAVLSTGTIAGAYDAEDVRDASELIVKSAVNRAAALLWKEWFGWSGNPWVSDSEGCFSSCFFCGEGSPDHERTCVFVRAKDLLVTMGETGYVNRDRT